MSLLQINWDELPAMGAAEITGGRRTALTIGVFDGLHRGHQALIAKIAAKAPELLPAVVTFRQNPKRCAFVSPEGRTAAVPVNPANPADFEAKTADPPRDIIGFKEKTAGTSRDIITFKEKIALLDGLGVSLCVIIDFSEHFSKTSGGAFLEGLNRYLRPAYMALGTNFHCGYRRDTDAAAFTALAERLGIDAEIVPPVLEGGLPVSSSRIRAALEAGDTGAAAVLLGRPAAL